MAVDKFINAALVENNDISSFFKNFVLLLKQKQKGGAGSDYFVRAILIFCLNNSDAISEYTSKGSSGIPHHKSSFSTGLLSSGGNNIGDKVQTVVERLADVIHNRTDDYTLETKAICAYIISKLKPSYWENTGLKNKRTNSSSSLTRKISMTLKSPSIIDFSPNKRDRTFTIPEGSTQQLDDLGDSGSIAGSQENFKENFKGSKGFLHQKLAKRSFLHKDHLVKSQSKYEFNSSSLDLSDSSGPETTYLFELVETLIERDQNDLIQSLTFLSKIIIERGQSKKLLERFKKEGIFNTIYGYFSKQYEEFETPGEDFELSKNLLQLNFCLVLYYQLATQNFDLACDLLDCDSRCFEALVGNLYGQAVRWASNEKLHFDQSRKNSQAVLILTNITSLIITTVDQINLHFSQRIVAYEKIAEIENENNEITIDVPIQSKETNLDDEALNEDTKDD